MEFTPWTFIVDFGIISVLLLLGKLLRAKIRFIQKLFLPPSLIAGFAALLLGPEVAGLLPLDSSVCGTYSAILIALVFACIPIASEKKASSDKENVGRMWAISNSGMLFQWALGGALGLGIFSFFWPGTESLGIAMPAGFCGGHGTAAAMGAAFEENGYADMMSISMTCATVGIIAAVVIGLAMIKWGTEHGMTSFLAKYSDLPDELRTGIVPKDKRDSIGEASFSAISLDSLTFNFGTIAACGAGGYGISLLVAHFWPILKFPTFICAFIVALIVRKVYDRTGASDHVCPRLIGHLSGTFTDYLVAFGVASIKVAVVWKLIVPLLIMIVVGLVATYLFVYYACRRMGGEYWFEKAVFTWGWFTGTMSMSIALLRIIDPDMRTGTLDQYAFAYVYVAPVEIALISLAPIAFITGFGWVYVSAATLGGIATLVAARKKGWLR